MVIGFDAKRLLHNNTGLGNYARNLISALLKRAPKHEYHLFAPEAGPHPPDWIHKSHASLVYHHPQTARLANGLRHSIWRTYGIARLAARFGVQLYHGLSHELPHGLSRHRISSIVTVHDLIFLRHPEWFPFADRFFYRQKVMRACRQANQIVAISECTARDIVDLLKISRERIRVIYQSVSPEFKPQEALPPFKQQTNSQQADSIYSGSASFGLITRPSNSKSDALPQNFILAVGSCDARKNYQTVLRAYAQLPEDRPPMVLTGRQGSERKKIEAQIRACKLADQIIWRQPKSAQELAHLYRQARFSVYLSRYEGFGLPVLESIACGTPVLAAYGSSLEEAGGNAAVYVQPNDAEAAALEMRRLLYDDAFHHCQAQLCAPWAAGFSPVDLAQTWLDLYGQWVPNSNVGGTST